MFLNISHRTAVRMIFIVVIVPIIASAIIGMLAAIVISAYNDYMNKDKVVKTTIGLFSVVKTSATLLETSVKKGSGSI